jgi:hypothetical protein
VASEVGSGQVAIFPTFKGFRSAVAKETDGAADTAATGFRKIFANTGTTAGRSTGKGFKDAFSSASEGFSAKATKALEADVARASKALSAARLKEQDAAGKTRLAETQLAEARSKYAGDSSQVVRAEERLASAQRTLQSAQDTTLSSTKNLKDAQGDLARAADRASDELADSGTRGSDRFRTNLVGGIRGIAAPIAAAVAAIGLGQIVGEALSEGFTFFKESITLASDLEQSVGGVSAVFKDQASTVDAWADSAAQSVGLSRSSYNEFATVVGSQFKNLGIPMSEVATQTNGLISLGADLAAQYGGSTSDAVSALSSLLRGERDPIERYGVSINQAAVDAKLAEMGLSGLTGEAERQAQVQATLALLTQQTADAQGAFGREADTAAGQQARLAASFENSKTALGTALLPTITLLTQLANDQLIPILNDVIQTVGPQLADALATSAPSFVSLVEAIAPLLPELIRMGAEALPPLLDLLVLISPLLIDWATNTAGVAAVINALFALLKGDATLGETADKILGLGGSAFEAAKAIGTWIGDIIGTIAEFAASVNTKIIEVVGFIGSLPSRAAAALGDLGGFLIGSGRALIQGFIDGIEGMLSNVGKAVDGIMEFVGGFFPNSPAKRGYFSVSGGGWQRLAGAGPAIEKQFQAGFGPDGLDPFGGAASARISYSGTTATQAAASPGMAGAQVSMTNNFDVRDNDPRVLATVFGREVAEQLAGA